MSDFQGPWIRWTIAGTMWDQWHRVKRGADRTACGMVIPDDQRIQEQVYGPPIALCVYCSPLVNA